MSRQSVVQITCSRCPRVEMAPTDTPSRALRIYVGSDPQKGGKPSTYFEDLCTPCMKLVETHLEKISTRLTKESPIRGKKTRPPKEG